MLDHDTLDRLTNQFSDIKIAEMYGLTPGRISQIRRQYGIKGYTQKTGNVNRNDSTIEKNLKLTFQKLDDLTNQFSDKEIAEQNGVSATGLTRTRKKLGVKSFFEKTGMVKVNGKVAISSNHGNVLANGHVTYFDNINTPDKAYFLGLAATDGVVNRNGSLMYFELQQSDGYILQEFIDYSGWPTKVNPGPPSHNSVLISLCSKYLVKELATWGITANKSKTLKMLREIPKHLESDFVRGCWDGDGHVGKINFSLVSASLIFIEQIQQIIYNNTGVKLHISKPKNGNPFSLQGGRTAPQVIRWIYSNSKPVLHRKAIQVSRFWV